MNKTKHLLLWSSLGVLALLLYAALEENVFRSWRRIQRSARAAGEDVEIRLRQIVVPELKITDRCITCHLGMAPGLELSGGKGVLAAHPEIAHSPSDFGCTVCHAGQGRATEAADAHGEVPFWPQPLIPLRYVEAGCGTCHTHLKVPHLDRFRQGAWLVERYDCLSCHRLGLRGGTLRADFDPKVQGPDLGRIGERGFKKQWYEDHLAAWKKASAGPWRESFGPIPAGELALIENFLRAQVGAPRLIEAKALFHSLGCRGCHKIRGIGGDDGPDLTYLGDKNPHLLDFSAVEGEHTLAGWLKAHLRNPPAVVPGSRMPVLDLSTEQIETLVLYLLSLRKSPVPEAYWPADRVRAERFGEQEFSADGETLFGAFCAACHGKAGEGRRYAGFVPFPAIGSKDLLAPADDFFLTETIRRGRPGRRMPAWGEGAGGLREEEIKTLVRYMRDLAGGLRPAPSTRPRRWVKAGSQQGRRLYQSFCAGCHGKEGEGPQAPALANEVFLETASDDFLIETIKRGRGGTAMPSFGKGLPAYPQLGEEEIKAIVGFIRSWEKARP